jgi:hypothetical protein
MRQPLIIPVSEREYELVEDYAYVWYIRGLRREIMACKGFRHDGASVPRLLWTLIGLRPDGLVRAAALLHDYLYRHGGVLPLGCMWVEQDMDPRPWTRKDADRLFARVMRESGVSKLKRRLAYLGVRVGGRRAWRNHENT